MYRSGETLVIDLKYNCTSDDGCWCTTPMDYVPGGSLKLRHKFKKKLTPVGKKNEYKFSPDA